MEITGYIAVLAFIVSIVSISLSIRQDRSARRLILAEKKGTLLVRVYEAREVQRGIVQVMDEIVRLGETTFKEDLDKNKKLLGEFDDLYQELGDPDSIANPATLELAGRPAEGVWGSQGENCGRY